MASILDERERGFESKWAHDQERHFEILARGHALLAQWAAGLLHLPQAEKDSYVRALVNAGVAGKGTNMILEKVRSDLAAGGVVFSEPEIRGKMLEFYQEAERGQIG